jgi:hypothetical protein
MKAKESAARKKSRVCKLCISFLSTRMNIETFQLNPQTLTQHNSSSPPPLVGAVFTAREVGLGVRQHGAVTCVTARQAAARSILA